MIKATSLLNHHWAGSISISKFIKNSLETVLSQKPTGVSTQPLKTIPKSNQTNTFSPHPLPATSKYLSLSNHCLGEGDLSRLKWRRWMILLMILCLKSFVFSYPYSFDIFWSCLPSDATAACSMAGHIKHDITPIILNAPPWMKPSRMSQWFLNKNWRLIIYVYNSFDIFQIS